MDMFINISLILGQFWTFGIIVKGKFITILEQ